MKPEHYAFAGGGTGGHLFPGLAVADAVRRQRPDARITFLTTTRPLDRQLLEPTPYAQVEQPVRPLTLSPLRIPKFYISWRRSVALARQVLRSQGVCAVLGLGGYAAGPGVVAARSLGIRTAILNPDVVPGKANRFLARRCDLVILQWDAAREHFPPNVECRTLGCPIRSTFAGADGEAGRRQFGLEAGRPVLLVTGASQGARSINHAVMRLWPAFHKAYPEWQLLHLTGRGDEDDVRRAYVDANAPAQVLSFTHEMPAALAAADVVISRAGASTLAELTALGKPAILLPYPYHRDQHQRANADVLVEAGAAVLVEDTGRGEANERFILDALTRMANPAARDETARAAAALGRAGAADEVAAWLLG